MASDAGGLAVNRAKLSAKLQTVNQTQQSIETLSKYCLIYVKDARGVVGVWDEEFHRANPEKRLSLLYLANHVLQEGRKGGKAFVEEFYRVLPKATSSLYRHSNEKMRKSVHRLVSIWEERRVFLANSMRAFKDVLNPAGASDSAAAAGGGGAAPGPGSSAAAAGAVPAGVSSALLKVQQSQDNCAQLQAQCDAAVQAAQSSRSSLADLAAARDSLSSCTSALEAEIHDRRQAQAHIHALLQQQAEGIQAAEDKLRRYEVQRTEIELLARMAEDAAGAAQAAQALQQQQQEQQQLLHMQQQQQELHFQQQQQQQQQEMMARQQQAHYQQQQQYSQPPLLSPHPQYAVAPPSAVPQQYGQPPLQQHYQQQQQQHQQDASALGHGEQQYDYAQAAPAPAAATSSLLSDTAMWNGNGSLAEPHNPSLAGAHDAPPSPVMLAPSPEVSPRAPSPQQSPPPPQPLQPPPQLPAAALPAPPPPAGATEAPAAPIMELPAGLTMDALSSLTGSNLASLLSSLNAESMVDAVPAAAPAPQEAVAAAGQAAPAAAREQPDASTAFNGFLSVSDVDGLQGLLGNGDVDFAALAMRLAASEDTLMANILSALPQDDLAQALQPVAEDAAQPMAEDEEAPYDPEDPI